MRERWRSADGWAVEVVCLAATPNRHDGPWIRVTHLGYYVSDVRDPAEVERWVRLAELEPDALRVTLRRSLMSWPVPGRLAAGRGQGVQHRVPGVRRRGPWRHSARPGEEPTVPDKHSKFAQLTRVPEPLPDDPPPASEPPVEPAEFWPAQHGRLRPAPETCRHAPGFADGQAPQVCGRAAAGGLAP